MFLINIFLFLSLAFLFYRPTCWHLLFRTARLCYKTSEASQLVALETFSLLPTPALSLVRDRVSVSTSCCSHLYNYLGFCVTHCRHITSRRERLETRARLTFIPTETACLFVLCYLSTLYRVPFHHIQIRQSLLQLTFKCLLIACLLYNYFSKMYTDALERCIVTCVAIQ